MKPEFCIVFICQAGELEIKSSLLAASLCQNLDRFNVDIVAAVPAPEVWGDISATTRSLMDRLGIREVIVRSPFGKEYPIGNKISAIGVATDAPITIFLDSDILCMQKLDTSNLYTQGLKAKPADLSTFSNKKTSWHTIYSHLGLDVPAHRVLSTVSKQVMLPYFNAGVICVKSGQEFSSAWLRIAKHIDEAKDVENKRPWLDQITLPVTVHFLNYVTEILGDAYNYPAHLKRIDESDVPILCHYHSPEVISEEPSLTSRVRYLCDTYEELNALLSSDEKWSRLITNSGLSKKSQKSEYVLSRNVINFINRSRITPTRDFLITGLPRSGTSLLCNLLHKGENTIVINEPKEVFAALSHDPFCNELQLFYRKLRSNIVSGRPIENKLDGDGNVVEDTSAKDIRKMYLPSFRNNDFLLATKNPLAYITRLRVICDAIPDMPKIVMIRHPLDVINSWTKNFEHLRNIDLSVIPFTSSDDKLLDFYQRNNLEQIRAQDHLPTRRALYFNYLAGLISRERERVTIIRYEDLIRNPKETLDQITNKIGASRLPSKVFANIKSSNVKLTSGKSENEVAISMLCNSFLEEWGYEL